MATYSNSETVRSEAGFEFADNIDNTDIESAQIRAFSLINGKVAARYKMPFEGMDGSPAADLLASIELLLASGLLLITEYGNESVGTDKDGYKKKMAAITMLDEIVAGTLKLLKLDGSEFENTSNLGVQKTTNLSIAAGTREDPKFTVGQKF